MRNFTWIGYFPDYETFEKIKRYKYTKHQLAKFNTVHDLEPSKEIFKAAEVKVLFKNKSIRGNIILIPLFLRHFPTLETPVILNKISIAVDYAIKNNSKVVMLAGALGDFVEPIKKKYSNRNIF